MDTTAVREFIDQRAELVHQKKATIGDFWMGLMAYSMFQLAKHESPTDPITDAVLSDKEIEDAYADFFTDSMREELRKMKAGCN